MITDFQDEVISPNELSKDKETTHSWKRWKCEIDAALTSKEATRWKTESSKAYKRFVATSSDLVDSPYRYNMFWAIIHIFESALFPWEKLPSPEVANRYKDKDALATAASEIYERCLIFKTDDVEIEDSIRAAIQDFLIGGRGQVWCRDINREDVTVEFVHRHDFLHEDARGWDEVSWVARKIQMTKDELLNEFGEISENINIPIEESQNDDEELRDIKRKIAKTSIWEIWDKRSRQVVWIPEEWKDKDTDDVLRLVDDPYKLKSFFPCPKPLLATTTSDSIWPHPDYHFYRFLIQQLDIVTERITNLIDACQAKALYDKSFEGVEKLAEATEGELVPVDNPRIDGKISDAISYWPIGDIANVLRLCMESQALIIQKIEETVGISDIVRGSTKASETATAQSMKGQYATLRLKQKQGKISNFIRDVYEIVGDLMTTIIPDEIIVRIVGGDAIPASLQPIIGESLEFLRNKKDLKFRVDIETSDTATIDQNEEKSRRSEFLHAFGQFMNMSVPMIQTFPDMAPVIGEVLMFGVRGFKAGRGVEGAIENAMGAIIQTIEQQKQQPPQPSPEQVKMEMEQAKMQQSQQDAQMKMQMEQAKAELQAQVAQAKVMLEQEKNEAKIQLELAKLEIEKEKARNSIAMEQAKGANDIEIAQIKASLDAQKKEYDMYLSERKTENEINRRTNSDL